MELDSEKLDKILNNPFFIGGVGSILALRWAPGVSWLERLFNVISGLVLAGFLSEPLSELLKLTSPSLVGGTAFLIGLFGMNVVAAVNLWIREVKLADLLPWVKKG